MCNLAMLPLLTSYAYVTLAASVLSRGLQLHRSSVASVVTDAIVEVVAVAEGRVARGKSISLLLYTCGAVVAAYNSSAYGCLHNAQHLRI